MWAPFIHTSNMFKQEKEPVGYSFFGVEVRGVGEKC